MNKLKF